jgi:CDP-diacylglycerol--serine O-phosphatidyltransferase
MKQIPNLFTLLNLIFGCFAIMYSLQYGIAIVNTPSANPYLELPEKMWMASLFIGLAAVVDFLDGFVARLFKATSPMGKQLDSLADIVSFGVAPGMIMYQFLRFAVAKEAEAVDTSILWLAFAFLIPAAAAWRLAKFNIATDQEYGFKGVPTPAIGLLVASLPLIYWDVDNLSWSGETFTNKWLLIGFIIISAVLMVSNLPLMGLKFKNFSVKDNWPKFLLIAIGIIAAIILKWLAVPAIFVAYVLISLLFQNNSKFKSQN